MYVRFLCYRKPVMCPKSSFHSFISISYKIKDINKNLNMSLFWNWTFGFQILLYRLLSNLKGWVRLWSHSSFIIKDTFFYVTLWAALCLKPSFPENINQWNVWFAMISLYYFQLLDFFFQKENMSDRKALR